MCGSLRKSQYSPSHQLLIAFTYLKSTVCIRYECVQLFFPVPGKDFAAVYSFRDT